MAKKQPKPRAGSAPEPNRINPYRARRWWLAVLLLAAVGLAAAWQWSPLRSLVDLDRLTQWSQPFAAHPAAPVFLIAAYVISALIMFPRPVLTLASLLVFGPWTTFLCAISGLLLAATIAFWAGKKLGREKLRLFARPYLIRLGHRLRRGGLMSVILLRLVPVAPFSVINLIAGAMGIRFHHFLLGTFIGLLPGTLTTVIVGDRLLAALRHPNRTNFIILATMMLLLVLGIVLFWRKRAKPFHVTGRRRAACQSSQT